MRAITLTIGIPFTQTETNKEQHTGQVTYSNRDEYQGDFILGKREGEGTYTFDNGDTYTGLFESGNFNGKGTYLTDNGDEYEGTFINNVAEGYGVLTFLSRTDADRYEGQFRNTRPEGKGTLFLPSGDKYEGGFQAGAFNGKGLLIYTNGDVYDGIYVNGTPSGQGKMLFANSKIVMNRNFQNGVDRADTKELKKNTFSIKKKKNTKVKIKKDSFIWDKFKRMNKGRGNPNLPIIQEVLVHLGIRGSISAKARETTRRIKKSKTNSKKTKSKRKSRTLRVASAKASITKKTRSIKKVRVTPRRVISRSLERVRAPQRRRKRNKYKRRNPFGPNYLMTSRLNISGTSKRKRDGINMEELFNNDPTIRRSKSIEQTLRSAEKFLSRLYGN